MSEFCDPITRNGSRYIQWIHTLFGSCVYGNREAASLLLGILSIGCWLNAQFPQLVTNYKNKSADGLSIQFLLIWLFGDVANFVGCILTKQLPFQTYLSMYFLTVDCALFLQYFYYTWLSPDDDEDVDCEESKELDQVASKASSIRSSSNVMIDDNINNNNNNDDSSNSNNSNGNADTFKKSINNNAQKNYNTFPPKKKELVSVTTLFAILLLTFDPISSSTYSSISTSTSSLLSQSYPSLIPSPSQNDDDISSSPTLSLIKYFLEDNSLIIGRVMAWICTTLYLTSRVPQICKNHSRKSVEGLSITMFIFSALGNLTYSLSIFTDPSASNDPSFLPGKIPYIIGSIGTLSFDITIFLQWCIWKDRIYHHHHYNYLNRRTRSATFHTHSSIRPSNKSRLSSSMHKTGYNTLPSRYYESNLKKQLRENNSSASINMMDTGTSNKRCSDEITSAVLINGDFFA